MTLGNPHAMGTPLWNHCAKGTWNIKPQRERVKTPFLAEKADVDMLSSLGTFAKPVWPETFRHQILLQTLLVNLLPSVKL